MSIKACRAALMGASMLTLGACVSITVTREAETVPVAVQPATADPAAALDLQQRLLLQIGAVVERHGAAIAHPRALL